MLIPCNFLLLFFVFNGALVTSVPDGTVEELGKEAYNERLNQRRNTEQHSGGVKADENVK